MGKDGDVGLPTIPVRQDGGYRVEQRLAAILFLDFGELGAQVRGVAEMLTIILIVIRYFPTYGKSMRAGFVWQSIISELEIILSDSKSPWPGGPTQPCLGTASCHSHIQYD